MKRHYLKIIDFVGASPILVGMNTSNDKTKTSKIQETSYQPLKGDVLSKDDIQNMPKEIGGNDGPEPTRYGDWETGGRCTDF